MEIVITSILAFVSTNIDDIFILTLFFGNKKFNSKEILTGQFLGILSLIVLSLIGSLVGLLVNEMYIGLLGLVPIYLGAKSLWHLQKVDDNKEDKIEKDIPAKRHHILAIAGVTIANGGDNIGIYIPLFASLTWINTTIMVAIFLVMTFLWCIIAKYFTTHPYVAQKVGQYGHVVTPFVLILLGCYILFESGAFALLNK